MSLIISTGQGARRSEYDLAKVGVGGRLARDLTQAQLFRALKGTVLGIDSSRGHQRLCEALINYRESCKPLDNVIARDEAREARQGEFDNLQRRLGI
jgi:hypothetical protein